MLGTGKMDASFHCLGTTDELRDNIQMLTVTAVSIITMLTEGLMWTKVAQRPRATLIFEVSILIMLTK